MYGVELTWYCMDLRLPSLSPFVMMMPFFTTLTRRRLRRMMAVLPAQQKHTPQKRNTHTLNQKEHKEVNLAARNESTAPVIEIR